MEKIDLDEIEASLGYLEDWKNVLNELRLARKVVEAANVFVHNFMVMQNGYIDPEMKTQLDGLLCPLAKLSEARRG
jgi:hypothetical protein